MATPTKLILTREDFGATEILIQDDLPETLFSFYETDNVTLLLTGSDAPDVQYEDCSTGEMKRLTVDEPTVISLGYAPKTEAYSVGTFRIIITHYGQSEERYFAVHSKQLEDRSVDEMRKYVNNFCQGLSLNMQKKFQSAFGNDSSLSDRSLLARLQMIKTQFPKILRMINVYVSQPYEELQRKPVLTSKPARFDRAALKWLVSRRIRYNRNLAQPENFMTDKSVPTINNRYNATFKKYLLFWATELQSLQNQLSASLNDIQAQLDVQNRTLQENIRNIDTIADNFKKIVQKNSEATQDNLVYNQNVATEGRQYLQLVSDYLRQLNNVINDSWVAEVNIGSFRYNDNQLPLRIQMLKEFTDQYSGLRHHALRSFASESFFAQKSTSKLFETFCYVMLINILKSMGFTADEPLQLQFNLLARLSTTSRLNFTGANGLKCCLAYDEALSRYPIKNAESGYYAFNSTHACPDFLLSFYTDSQGLIKTLVLDTKWRRFYNIYDEQKETKVMGQLKDYGMLVHYDAKTGRLNRSAIDEVIVLYPSPKETLQPLVTNLITSISVNPTEVMDNTVSYQLLKNELESNLISNRA